MRQFAHMAQRDDYGEHDDLGWFRDLLRQRDREIAELRRVKDELTDLVRRLSQRTSWRLRS